MNRERPYDQATWQEGVAIAVVLLGLGAGAFLVALRPSFWIEFGARLGKVLLPLAWRYVSRRMPPEEEAAWRAAEKRGQGDKRLRERLHSRKKTPPPSTGSDEAKGLGERLRSSSYPRITTDK